MMDDIDKLIKEWKVGELVRYFIPLMLKKEILKIEEVTKLQSTQYSKTAFNINFPVLKKVKPERPLMDSRFVNGYPRFYAKPIKYKGVEYLITSEWPPNSKEDFVRWLKKKFN